MVGAGAVVTFAGGNLGASCEGHGDAIPDPAAFAPAVANGAMAIGLAMVIGAAGGQTTTDLTGRVFDAEGDRIRSGNARAGRIHDEPTRAISEDLGGAGSVGRREMPIAVAEGPGDDGEAIGKEGIGCGLGERGHGDR